MAVHFSDKIRLQVITLYQATDVAAMSFKLQRSVNHLDLSTNEFGFRKKSVFTNESIQKWFQPRRQILYKYHLDLPTERCYSKNKFRIVIENVFHQYSVFISDSVYNLHFEIYIVEAINSQKNNKIRKLRRYMKIIKLLKFQPCSTAALYLYDNILPILYRESCRNSKLVVSFANLFNFFCWIMVKEEPFILYYVLNSAQDIRSSLSLSLFTENKIDPVTGCFLRHKIGHIPILLQFGAPSAFPRTFNFKHFISYTEKLRYRTIQWRITDQRRAFFLFQLWYDFHHHQNSPEGLRCIWKCINDPFLSRTEIKSMPLVQEQTLTNLTEHYQNDIIGRECSSKPSPRTLKDLCRVEVRRFLNTNHQLPFGIYNLDIPNHLKSYLKLFT